MGKQPAFQFYTGDWLKDTGVLSLESRGAWIDLLCYMWHNKERGILFCTLHEYSRLLRTTNYKTNKIINELISLGICDCYVNDKKIEKKIEFFFKKMQKNVQPFSKKNDKNFSKKTRIKLINRRMINDEKQRFNTNMRVEKHRKLKRYLKHEYNTNITPQKHASSSSSSIKKIYKRNFNCNGCEFGNETEKNFFNCKHPYIEKLGIKEAIKKLNIIGSDKERDEWFNWPERYNINWLFNCNGFNENI